MAMTCAFAPLRLQIKEICRREGRDPFSVRLTAVSKNQPDEAIETALESGLKVFGENRVQEAESHWIARRAAFPDLELHLIGGLQTNKAKQAVALFDVIETVDRPELVDALVKECQKQAKFPRFFVQVNIGEEPQKSGVAIDDLSALLAYALERGMTIEGLMCIPPEDEPSGLYFALLRKLALRHHLRHLSMGMSRDFRQAIALDATYIRIGTALFGARDFL
ncbi:MAG: YggS family pyridoxal phosphate-dependent enzyme [Alphaproteobacteria bacterium]|nr:YggS family pyridoxal phosphate-dependent enzyme [Alphaproteobacteria bacterium]MCB1551862.1 YggS family pyridoxal phosphate-dependent enzyme [Alphaproteobacteria bacterium]MCB9985832.1 YggS family pyridoxal phosphate-dependent enzyme [Micavibrio sp.]